MKKIKIGVVIYTKIGTNTSILTDEFRFFNEFAVRNPDCEFVFISVSKFTRNSLLKNKHLLNIPMTIVDVNTVADLPKLSGLSGVFSYMLRNTFFGGTIDKACAIAYRILSYSTNELNLPLFIRTPDSEYPYYDYLNMADVRIEAATASTPKFIEHNKKELVVMGKTYINYDNVYYIANGSRKIADWVVDIAHNDIKDKYQMSTPEKISAHTLFVPDSILFNIWHHYKNYEYLPKKATVDKLIFIGYLSGSVAKNRLKAIPKIFKENKHTIPTVIIGPGATDLGINRPDVEILDEGVYGKDFFEKMNSHLAYIFVGKGNSTNKYINKTVYDCISARCPVIVYSACDTTGKIFDNKEYYFSNEDELLQIYNKLKDPEIRERWIDQQYEEIKMKLETLSDPLFSFNQFCEPKSEKIEGMKLQPLF